VFNRSIDISFKYLPEMQTNKKYVCYGHKYNGRRTISAIWEPAGTCTWNIYWYLAVVVLHRAVAPLVPGRYCTDYTPFHVEESKQNAPFVIMTHQNRKGKGCLVGGQQWCCRAIIKQTGRFPHMNCEVNTSNLFRDTYDVFVFMLLICCFWIGNKYIINQCWKLKWRYLFLS